jgi:hypothetical protein
MKNDYCFLALKTLKIRIKYIFYFKCLVEIFPKPIFKNTKIGITNIILLLIKLINVLNTSRVKVYYNVIYLY